MVNFSELNGQQIQYLKKKVGFIPKAELPRGTKFVQNWRYAPANEIKNLGNFIDNTIIELFEVLDSVEEQDEIRLLVSDPKVQDGKKLEALAGDGYFGLYRA